MATHFKGPIVSEDGFTGDVTGDLTGNVTGDVTGDVDGYVTAQKETIAATSTGVQIAANTDFVAITSAGANNIVILPDPVVGKVVKGAIAGTGCEIRSSTPTAISVNNVIGTGKEAALAANSSFEATCVGAAAWILHEYSATGTATNPTPD